jgi:hypothetical protein
MHKGPPRRALRLGRRPVATLHIHSNWQDRRLQPIVVPATLRLGEPSRSGLPDRSATFRAYLSWLRWPKPSVRSAWPSTRSECSAYVPRPTFATIAVAFTAADCCRGPRRGQGICVQSENATKQVRHFLDDQSGVGGRTGHHQPVYRPHRCRGYRRLRPGSLASRGCDVVALCE